MVEVYFFFFVSDYTTHIQHFRVYSKAVVVTGTKKHLKFYRARCGMSVAQTNRVRRRKSAPNYRLYVYSKHFGQ